MRQLETNLNYISSLPDDPAMTTTALKQEFDKAGNVIKTFINEELEEDITTDIASCLATAKDYTDTSVGAIDLNADNINYDNTTSGLEATNTQDAIDEVVTTTSAAEASKTEYSDFETSTHSSGTLDNGHGGYATKTISITKSGYYPLGIVGFKSTGTKVVTGGGQINMGATLAEINLTSASSGSGEITGKTYCADNASDTYKSTFTVDVLWVKVR